MSDFLMNIIERAENRAPVLQRRPRALFEAGSIPNDLPVATDVAVESHSGARFEAHPLSVVPERAHSREASRDSHQTVEQPDSHADARSAHRASGRDTDVPRARSLHEDRSAGVFESARRPVAAPIEKPAEQAQHIATPVIDARIERRPVERAASHVEKPPSIVVKRSREEPAPAQHPQLPRDRVGPVPTALVRVTKVDAKNQPPPTPRATAVPTKRASTTAVMLAKAQSAKSVSPQIAPVPAPVHISIGRVEVRATAASQSTARTTKNAGPRLKLDDYLNDRNRGGR